MSLPGKRSQSRESTLKRNSPCSVIMSWLYLITDSVSDISRIFLPTSAPFCPTRLHNEGEKESCPSAHCQSAHVCMWRNLYSFILQKVFISLSLTTKIQSYAQICCGFEKQFTLILRILSHLTFSVVVVVVVFCLISTIRDKHK